MKKTLFTSSQSTIPATGENTYAHFVVIYKSSRVCTIVVGKIVLHYLPVSQSGAQNQQGGSNLVKAHICRSVHVDIWGNALCEKERVLKKYLILHAKLQHDLVASLRMA